MYLVRRLFESLLALWLASIIVFIDKIRARRTSIYLYHQNLFAAHSVRVVGLDMFADGMPRLKSVGFVAGK